MLVKHNNLLYLFLFGCLCIFAPYMPFLALICTHLVGFFHFRLVSNPTPQMKWTNYENFVNLCETTQVALDLSSGARTGDSHLLHGLPNATTNPDIGDFCGAWCSFQHQMGFVWSSQVGNFTLGSLKLMKVSPIESSSSARWLRKICMCSVWS